MLLHEIASYVENLTFSTVYRSERLLCITITLLRILHMWIIEILAPEITPRMYFTWGLHETQWIAQYQGERTALLMYR